jgi:hypothetical protein
VWRASVSNIESFRQWSEDEDLELSWLLQRILGPFEQTPAMRAGELFHKALETMSGDAATLTADGFTFHIDCDIELVKPDCCELPISMDYGGLVVTGRVDAVFGSMVYDHKTTAQFDPDRLMSGYQWRYYLDILGVNRFAWNVFVMKEVDFKEYKITDFHVLEQRRYPELHLDCMNMATKYRQFAKTYLPTKAVDNDKVLEIANGDWITR